MIVATARAAANSASIPSAAVASWSEAPPRNEPPADKQMAESLTPGCGLSRWRDTPGRGNLVTSFSYVIWLRIPLRNETL